MRTQIVLLWISLSLMVGLSACDWTSSSPVASLRRATGWPFEVVVVMDQFGRRRVSAQEFQREYFHALAE